MTDIFPHNNFIGFTDSYKRAVEETDATIILVNTQLGDTGYSAEFVESALTDLAVNLKRMHKGISSYNIIINSLTWYNTEINSFSREIYLVKNIKKTLVSHMFLILLD